MAQRTFPDGEPRRAEDDPGSVGGSTPGAGGYPRALRHADGTEPPAERIGWLDGVKGIVGSPNRAANGEGVNIGPSSALWRKPGKR